MKKEYMIPAMRVVRIQQQHIICTSPGGYNSQPVQMHRGSSEEQIDDEKDVW
jgi:hypothetical protein